VGLFDWFKGPPKAAPPVAPVDAVDKKVTWVREQIRARAQSGDAVSVADAAATLGGAGSMVFGMVIGDLPGRDELREEALEALRAMMPTISDAHCDATFAIVTRASLPVEIEPRRTRLMAARQVGIDQAASKIRQVLASCDVGMLVDACIALQGFNRQVAGVALGGTNEERQALLEPALARLRGLLPTLPDEQCDTIFASIRRARLPIDVSARSSEMTERRRVERERAIAQGGLEPRNEALEHAIAADPDDADAYSVFSDWLQQQGHPRGELIALQLGAESDPSLQAAADGYLLDHTPELLGPLLLHRQTHDGSDREAFRWRRGFIDHARLSYDENAVDRPVSVAEILGLLLAHPSGRLLASLDLGMNGMNDESLDDVLAILIAQPPATLRALLLGDFTQEQSDISYFNIGDVAPLWPALSGLRKLVVHGGVFELGTIEHALLEHAEFKTGGLSAENAQAIATAQWPRLRHLDVWYGDPNYGGEATIDDVLPLLARADLPGLVHLGLMNAAFTDDICGALPGSALAPQLRELDLSLGTMSDDGAAVLARAAAAFPKLTRLDVSCNYVSVEAIATLRGAFAEVVTTEQRHAAHGDDRYPSVGE
jgi:uncharacterized protein (TIGR02996 family)